MKKKLHLKGVCGIGISLALLCTLAAPAAMAVEATDGNNYDYMVMGENQTDELYGVDGAGDTAAAASSQADTESTASEYSLASEDWGALLGVAASSESDGLTVTDESEPAMSGWLFGGNAKSDGGLSRVLIAAIIAFALGAVGVAFFIYSQFIYKAKLRRKAAEEENGFDGYDTDEAQPEPEGTPENIPPRGERPSGAQASPGETSKAPPASSTPHESVLSEEDEEKLREVDWDQFFNDNEK